MTAESPSVRPPQRRPKRRGRRRTVLLLLLAVVVAVFAVPASRMYVLNGATKVSDRLLTLAPAPDMGPLLDRLPQRNRILTADGNELAQSWWQDRTVVDTGAIAPVMREAQVAIEDARFYEHGSVDATGLLRAVWSNVTSGDATGQGASTIDQQLAKNLTQLQAELDDDDAAVEEATDKTISRKVDDLVLAAHLGTSRDKDQILTDYLNVVYYGQGAYGIQSAAQRYFGVDASALTLPQAALIAGLVQSPSAYDPVENPQAAQARRDEVLAAMRDQGRITNAQFTEATSAPLGLNTVAQEKGCAASSQQAFCDFAVRRLLASPELGDDQGKRDKAWKTGGLTLTTTLDPKVQQATTEGIAAQKVPEESLNEAVAVVRPGTGAVLALGQDVPYGDQPGETLQSMAIDAADGGSAVFQGGSTFKAFTLAAAYAKGYRPESVIDAPKSGTTFTISDFRSCEPLGGGTWAPKNVEGDPDGPMTLIEATAKSVNTAFVALEADVGLCEVRDAAQNLGMRQSDGKPLEVVPSLTLGSSPTSPLTLAGAYAAFANEGRYCTPTPIASVTGAGRSTTFAPACRQAVSPEVARQMRATLREVVTDGTGDTADIPGRRVAGKTGTTDTSSSTWFAGFDDDLAAAAWVGDPQGGTYDRLHGGDVAAPLWKQVISRAATD